MIQFPEAHVTQVRFKNRIRRRNTRTERYGCLLLMKFPDCGRLHSWQFPYFYSESFYLEEGLKKNKKTREQGVRPLSLESIHAFMQCVYRTRHQHEAFHLIVFSILIG